MLAKQIHISIQFLLRNAAAPSQKFSFSISLMKYLQTLRTCHSKGASACTTRSNATHVTGVYGFVTTAVQLTLPSLLGRRLCVRPWSAWRASLCSVWCKLCGVVWCSWCWCNWQWLQYWSSRCAWQWDAHSTGPLLNVLLAKLLPKLFKKDPPGKAGCVIALLEQHICVYGCQVEHVVKHRHWPATGGGFYGVVACHLIHDVNSPLGLVVVDHRRWLLLGV